MASRDLRQSDLIEWLRERAFAVPARIALSDGTDPRVVEAARFLAAHTLIEPILIGARNEAPPEIQGSSMQIYDPAFEPRQKELIDLLEELETEQGRSLVGQYQERAADPTLCGTLMVRKGWADGVLGGANVPTATVIRAGLRVIGVASRPPLVSGVYIMVLERPLAAGQEVLVLGDPAVIPYPTPEQLAQIALNTALVAKLVAGLDPIVAFLSFSTHGSASHQSVSQVREAVGLFKAMKPDWPVDGELQADAALIPEVARRKAPGGDVKGRANVLIFPNLDAGNIAYKLIERVAGATALGVILSGWKQPVNDLSRGCSVDDVINMVAVTVLQGLAG